MPRNAYLHLQLWMTTALLAVSDHIAALATPSDDDHDRGDVPGWVMITVMTAAVVIALLGVFRTQVLAAVTNAFDSVSGAGTKQ